MNTVDNILAVILNRGDLHVNGDVNTTRRNGVSCVSITVHSQDPFMVFFNADNLHTSRSQWPRGRIQLSVASRLLELRVRTQPGRGCLFECCVLLGRGLCVGLITRPEESYRMW